MTYKPANPNGQATMANSEPVVIASDQSVIPVKGTQISLPSDTDEYVSVRPLPQTKTFYGFEAEISNDVQSDLELLKTGTGMTVNQTGGSLLLTSGTTTGTETVIRSVDSWSDAITLRYSLNMGKTSGTDTIIELVDIIGDGLNYVINSSTSLTVTIPSNPFTAENVGQLMTVGMFSGTGTFSTGLYAVASVIGNNVTFTVSGFAVGTGTCSIWGWNAQSVNYVGSQAPTSAAFYTIKNGRGTAEILTVQSTSGTVAGYILNVEDGVATFADQSINPSTTTLQTTIRAQFVEHVPDPSTNLYLQIRVNNGLAAPALSVSSAFKYVTIENYRPQQVSLTSVRLQSFNAAIPVSVQGLVPGVTATSLGKAEDTVHVSGDTGVMMLAVSAATATSFGASGDYTPISVDTFGRVRVTGSVGSNTAVANDVIVVGGRANSSIPTAVSPGTAVFAFMDLAGRQVVTQRADTATVTSVSASITSVQLLGTSTTRQGATIYNDSTSIMYLKLGTTASTTSFTVKMQPEDYYEVPFGYAQRIDGIWAAATGSARITEII